MRERHEHELLERSSVAFAAAGEQGERPSWRDKAFDIRHEAQSAGTAIAARRWSRSHMEPDMTYEDPDKPRPREPTGPAMSYCDPNEPTWRAIRAQRAAEWSAESIAGAILVLVIVLAAIGYAANRGSTLTAGAPNISQSAPSTTGQGGPAPR